MASASSSTSKIIFLKSSDGETFEVDESVAQQCLTIKHMMEDLDDSNTSIPLPNVAGKTLSKVIEYCKKHVGEANTKEGNTSSNKDDLKKHVDDPNTKEGNNSSNKDDLKEWDKEFLKVLDLNTVFELLLAANYMDVKSLLDITCQHVADSIKDKKPEEVRKIFNIENDFTPEEEEALRLENAWA